MFAAATSHSNASRTLVRRGLDWCARLMSVEEPALWTIAHGGRIVGVLNREAEGYRLDWFEGADARLAGYAGPLSADTAALAQALEARLGGSETRVRILAVPL